MSANPERRYTLEEYFDLDRSFEAKFEYWDGNVWEATGESPEHSLIQVNLAAELSVHLRDRNGLVFPSSQRIKVPTFPPYRYPDLSALCGKPVYEEIGGIKTLVNPQILVEILSPTTEAFDRGDKFTYYKSIPSFCEYILVAQHRPHVTRFVKTSADEWVQTEVNDLVGSVTVKALDCRIALAEIYRGIEFAPAHDQP